MDTLGTLYFPVVGWWLLAGSVVFMGCVVESFADKLLRQWTAILSQPYTHGPYGHIFVLWAGMLNVALGAFLILAPDWDPEARRAVLIATNVGYAIFFGLAIAALRSPKYGPGMWVSTVLWGTLLAWGAVAMVQGA